MLTVDAEQRITVDEALQHPFLTGRGVDSQDSTDGLTSGIEGLDFSTRMPERQRTLLAEMVSVEEQKCFTGSTRRDPVKIFEKTFRDEQRRGEHLGRMDEALAKGEKRAVDADKETGLRPGEAEKATAVGNARMEQLNQDRKRQGPQGGKANASDSETHEVGLFMDIGEKGDPTLFDAVDGEEGGGTISEGEEPTETRAK